MSTANIKDTNILLQEMFREMDAREARRSAIVKDMLGTIRELRFLMDKLEDEDGCLENDQRCCKPDCEDCMDTLREIEDRLGQEFPDKDRYWKMFKNGDCVAEITDQIWKDQDHERGEDMLFDLEYHNE